MASIMEVETELLTFWKRAHVHYSEYTLCQPYGMIYLEGSAWGAQQQEAEVGFWGTQTVFQFLTLSHNGCVTSGKWLTCSGPCLLICRTGMLLYILKCPCECSAYTRYLINGSALEKEVEKAGGPRVHIWGLGTILTGSEFHPEQLYFYFRHNSMSMFPVCFAVCLVCVPPEKWTGDRWGHAEQMEEGTRQLTQSTRH